MQETAERSSPERISIINDGAGTLHLGIFSELSLGNIFSERMVLEDCVSVPVTEVVEKARAQGVDYESAQAFYENLYNSEEKRTITLTRSNTGPNFFKPWTGDLGSAYSI